MAKQVRTLEERLRIIEEVDKNPSLKRVEIARRLGLRPSTLNSIISKREGIKEQASKLRTSAMRRKTCKESLYSELEEILYTWYREARASNICVNGNVLREKALQIAASKGLDSFCASNGWISRFKERHGLVFERLSGGEGGTLNDTNAADIWFQKLPDLLQGYEDHNIYTAGETGLYFNSLPDSSWVFKGETGRSSKERLTILLCTNKDGSDKRLPLVVSKSQRPLQCYENPGNLPVTYHPNPKACITNEIFEGYLRDLDALVSEQGRKIVLFVGSCSASSSDVSTLRNVEVIFYPQDCTRAVQPLDTGVIKCFKQGYRRRLEQRALMEEGAKGIHLKIDILEAIDFVLSAWQQVTQATILDSFVKCGYLRSTEDRLAVPSRPPLNEDWLRKMQEAGGSGMNPDVPVDSAMNIEGIPFVRSGGMKQEKDCDMEQDQKADPKPPNIDQAVAAFETVRSFLYAHELSEEDKKYIVNVENLLLRFKNKSSIKSQK